MAHEPRGRIVTASRQIPTATGIVMAGRKVLVVAYVKTGSKRCRTDFWLHVGKLGLAAKTVQTLGGDDDTAFLTAFEVVGTPESLATLVTRYCVADWHWAVDVQIGRVGAGGGEMPKRTVSPRQQERAERVTDLCRNDANVPGLATLDRHAIMFATN